MMDSQVRTEYADRMKRLLLLFVTIAAAAFVAHLAWSAALAAAVELIYDHRVFNVRKVRPAYDFVMFSEQLLRSKIDRSKPTVIVAGASVTFANSFSDNVIFSRRIARNFPNANVLNLSVVGTDGPSIAYATACALRHAGIVPDLVVLELPVINDTVHAKRQFDHHLPLRPEGSFVCPSESISLFRYFVMQPRGSSWVAIIRDDSIDIRMGGGIRLAPLERDYVLDDSSYQKIVGILEQSRIKSMRALSATTKRLLVYPGPLHIESLAKLGFDAEALKRQVADTVKACRAVGSTVCLDTREFPDDQILFSDVSHLSPEGHIAFAGWLTGSIAAALAANN